MLSMYGMTAQEQAELRLNLSDDFKDKGISCLDSLYIKWNEED